MLKGVKGLWMVLNPKDRLLSPKDYGDTKVPATWSDYDDAKDDTKIESDQCP